MRFNSSCFCTSQCCRTSLFFCRCFVVARDSCVLLELQFVYQLASSRAVWQLTMSVRTLSQSGSNILYDVFISASTYGIRQIGSASVLHCKPYKQSFIMSSNPQWPRLGGSSAVCTNALWFGCCRRRQRRLSTTSC